MKYLLFALITLLILLAFYVKSHGSNLLFTNKNAVVSNSKSEASTENRSLSYVTAAYHFAKQKHYNTRLFFIADLSVDAGKNRFYVYNFNNRFITDAGIVAHGSCNTAFLQKVKFSNEPGCGCSSFGKYKVGYKYKGRFGDAYKLYGLDSSNSNAFARNIVLHHYYAVPDNEVYPKPVCNSLGCIMVSDKFFKKLSKEIDASPKPILLWVIN